MTGQRAERIWLDDALHDLLEEPLRSYLRSMEDPPELPSWSTALWRGYVGTWKVEDDSLFLVDVEADGGGIELIFGDTAPPILADWYTGTLRVGIGDVVDYHHGGFDRRYETERNIEVEDGRVVGETVRHFGPDGELPSN